MKAEPSVHNYNISRNIFNGKFNASFEHKGKMFNNLNIDSKYNPSPQDYRVNVSA